MYLKYYLEKLRVVEKGKHLLKASCNNIANNNLKCCCWKRKNVETIAAKDIEVTYIYKYGIQTALARSIALAGI